MLLLLFTLLWVGVYGQTFVTVNEGDWNDPDNWYPAIPTFSLNDEIYIVHQMTNIPKINIDGSTLFLLSSAEFDTITGNGTIDFQYAGSPLNVSFKNLELHTLYLNSPFLISLMVDGDWNVQSFTETNAGNYIEFSGIHNILSANSFLTTNVVFTGTYEISRTTSFGLPVDFHLGVTISGSNCTFAQDVNIDGTSAINANTTFSGNVNVLSGTLTIASSTLTSFMSKFNIYSGAIVNLSTGFIDFNDPIYVSGQLLDNSATGTVNINDSLIIRTGGELATNSGILTLNNAIIMNNGVFNSNELRSTGTTYINGTHVASANKLTVNSGTTINNISSINGGFTVNSSLSANVLPQISCTLENNGLITYKGTTAPMGSKTLTTTDANSEFVYGGSSAQSIKATNYYKLKINNAAGASLPGSITVLNNLNLTSGIVTPTNLSFVLTVNDNATASNASSSSFIAGKCKKIGNDAFTFPVGKSGHYSPVTITAPSLATDAFTVEYFFADPQSVPYNVNLRDAGLSQISRREYWMVDRTTGSSSIDVALTWNSARSGDITDINDLRVVHWNGSSWEDKGQNNLSGDANAGEIRSNTNSSFSPFTIGSSSTENPLPVSLVSFDVFCPGQNNIVTWQTASETNASYFDLEGSTDGETWYVRGTVESARNSNSIMQYSVIDPKQVNEIKYYRLRQFDVDGRFSYSHIIQVGCTIDGIGDVKIFPNPATDIITLNGSNSIIGSTAYIYNSLNQLVGEYKIGESTTNIDIESLPSGIYILQVRDGSRNILNHRLVVE